MDIDGAFSVVGFCAWAGVGRTFTYGLIARGRLKAVKVGGRTLIPKSEARAWLASLPAINAKPSEREVR
jgi:excisionase family DNA binding protein